MTLISTVDVLANHKKNQKENQAEIKILTVIRVGGGTSQH